MLDVKDLSKTFASGAGKVQAIKSVSFSVPTGAFAAIVGKSGSGKSTLLSLLGGLDTPTKGSIKVDGKEMAKLSEHTLVKYRRNNIGFIFQSYNLIPNLSALENVMLPMEFAHMGKSKRIERAKELLNEVGVTEDKQKRKPSRLSGGEQQRVAIARALANKPSLILADEPTGNLDSKTSKMVVDLLSHLAKTENTTILVVTHDLNITHHTDMTFQIQDGCIIDRGNGNVDDLVD
jgi:putative ABC transport system ATP-binding protein